MCLSPDCHQKKTRAGELVVQLLKVMFKCILRYGPKAHFMASKCFHIHISSAVIIITMFTNHSRNGHFRLKPSLSVVTLHANCKYSITVFHKHLKKQLKHLRGH